MPAVWLCLLLVLAGCGIDGAPERPAPPPGAEDEILSPGVVIGGEVMMGGTGNF